jgi:Relaxase/Mobilisation nuclease domain
MEQLLGTLEAIAPMSEGLIDHLKAILSKKTFEKREILLHEGEQPYLVYRHHDTTSPHLHIVMPKINANGSSRKRLKTKTRIISMKELKELFEDNYLLGCIKYNNSYSIYLMPIA